MVQEYEQQTAKSKTAAEIDAQFIEHHPIEGRVVQLGAAFTGGSEAVIKAIDETKELVGKTIAPGDMNPAHMPHPIDAATKSIASLTETRDMRIENSPHPKDNVIAAINSKVKEIEQAGVIEGTRIGAGVIVSATMDIIGPTGKAKATSSLIDELGESALNIGKLAPDNVATTAFFHEAVRTTEKQLNNATEEYARTAQLAKTFGTQFGKYAGHEDALVRFEIASIKLDAIKHGGDASIHNPVIADLLKHGKDSDHFFPKNIMDEVNKYDDSISLGIDKAAMVEVTKLAHENRLNRLSDKNLLPNEGNVNHKLTLEEQLELAVGAQYGANAAAHARVLRKDGELEKANTLYPQNHQARHEYYGNLMSENLNDYISMRQSLIESMNVNEMRILAKIETQKLEQLIQNLEPDVFSQHPEGVERRIANQSGTPGVIHTSYDEYMIAKSGAGERAGDARVQKASESLVYEQFSAEEARRNRSILEVGQKYSELELSKYRVALEYLQERQKLIDQSNFDNDPDGIRKIFKEEEQRVINNAEHKPTADNNASKKESVSFNDAVSHLPTESQQYVLASIQKTIENNNRQLNDPQFT